ncbi:MAG: hypothetical protein ACRELC_01280 [Gemmatimonadota bacterium]
MRCRVLTALFVLAFASCRSDDSPLQPPAGEAPPPPAAAVSDGANGGTSGFFFLPPLVSNPNPTGSFSPSLSPAVEIWELPGTAVCTPDAASDPKRIERFDGADIIVESDHYKLEWDTQATGLDTEKNYRILVCVDDLEIGFADVDPAATGKDMKTAAAGDFALKDGRTLPVRFFLALEVNTENLIIATFSNDAGGTAVMAGPGETTGEVVLDVDPNFIPPELGVDELTFILRRVDQDAAPFERCLDLPGDPFPLEQRDICVFGQTEPDLDPMGLSFQKDGAGISRVRLSHCLDQTGLSAEALDQFQGWQLKDDGTRVPLQNLADPSELDCAGFPPAPPIGSRNPVVNLARATWRGVKGTLAALFAPRALVATDKGRTQGIGSFSNAVWARTLVMTKGQGDNQTGAPSTTLVTQPEVLVQTPAPHLEPGDDPFQVTLVPAMNVPVTFTPSGDGAVGTQPSFTNAYGSASTPWTLPSTGTTATLVATAPALSQSGPLGGGTISFTATIPAVCDLSDLAINASIDDVALSSTMLTIGGPTVPYTATLTNAGDPLPCGVVLQGYIDQTSQEASRAAGGTLLSDCGTSLGAFPVGTCGESFTLIASNATAGSGTLVPGAATARLELIAGGVTIATFTVAVTLVAAG